MEWCTASVMLCVVAVAPEGGLELAFPRTAAAVGTH